MPRLRRVDCANPAISHRRRGRGFEYLDESGERIEDPDALERIRALAIPPDWPEIQRPIEEAVLDLIDRRESSAAIEWVT
jgi:DNA topoisomerase IB